MFEPGPPCEDWLHLAGNSIFDNLIILKSLKPWLKKKRFLKNFKIVGVKDVRPNNSIGGSCVPDQKFFIVYTAEKISKIIRELRSVYILFDKS
jgi:hypothetical protein